MADEHLRILTRRDLLRVAGAVGAAAVARPGVIDHVEARQVAAGAGTATRTREAFEHLTAAEADLVEAIAERLIPTDSNGPGAREARVVRYIDRALGGALAASRQAYAAGLPALDRYAQSSHGRGFLQLAPADQDAVLSACEKGEATGFAGAASFFAMVLAHTRQGMFGDPYYGGNVNFVGWDLIGYPGVRTMVTAADQKALEADRLRPNHKSAYDFDTFTKASARVSEPGNHGQVAAGHFDSEGGQFHGD
ncbi:MAG: hypothetical protein DMF90_20715 [Acidobacteria bacterium]|nr:MAG: hypothetical protein DMF90_20715 [Acidobacteriota bacterium]